LYEVDQFQVLQQTGSSNQIPYRYFSLAVTALEPHIIFIASCLISVLSVAIQIFIVSLQLPLQIFVFFSRFCGGLKPLIDAGTDASFRPVVVPPKEIH